MNKRIDELIEECTSVNDDLVYDGRDSYMKTTEYFDKEKFAELIVRECALVAKTLPHTPERHWVTDSVTYIPVHCEQNILKHFGVEE